MEGFIAPKQLVLVSPYTANLGEHAFWVTEKAKEYPRAFARYETFTRAMYEKHMGPVPADFRDKLYMYWGEVFFRLKDDEQLMAMLHYLDFHVVDSMPHKGEEASEPYAAHRLLIAHPENISVEVRDILIRLATIDAHWWRSNFQDGYPFLEKLKAAHIACPVRIISGENDRIVPPHTARALGDILGCAVDIVPNSCHMPELKMPGDLQKHMARTLAEAARSQR
jgi:pimeloyl-ACP methyl ester carboxylesterase